MCSSVPTPPSVIFPFSRSAPCAGAIGRGGRSGAGPPPGGLGPRAYSWRRRGEGCGPATASPGEEEQDLDREQRCGMAALGLEARDRTLFPW